MVSNSPRNRLVSEALAVARENLVVARRSLGDRHPEYISATYLLSVALTNHADPDNEDDFVEAEELLTYVLKKAEVVYGPRHPRTTRTADRLAAVRGYLVDFGHIASPKSKV